MASNFIAIEWTFCCCYVVYIDKGIDYCYVHTNVSSLKDIANETSAGLSPVSSQSKCWGSFRTVFPALSPKSKRQSRIALCLIIRLYKAVQHKIIHETFHTLRVLETFGNFAVRGACESITEYSWTNTATMDGTTPPASTTTTLACNGRRIFDRIRIK
jgi:hypothetical protein